jgi:hypothetical protein
LRLRAAGLSATGDVTLGGRAVASGGRWRAPRRLPRLAGTPGHLELRLPPASAALVELRRR